MEREGGRREEGERWRGRNRVIEGGERSDEKTAIYMYMYIVHMYIINNYAYMYMYIEIYGQTHATFTTKKVLQIQYVANETRYAHVYVYCVCIV